MDSLDNQVNNLSVLYDCKCHDKSAQVIKIKYSDKNIYTRCKTCLNRKKQSINSLISKFSNTYQLAQGNLVKFILLLKRGVYPYEYMDNWEKFNATVLPTIDKFYSSLNLKNISKKDHNHGLNVWDTFNIKNLAKYHDLYVQADTAQLADTFEQFRLLCLEKHKLDPAHFLLPQGLHSKHV